MNKLRALFNKIKCKMILKTNRLRIKNSIKALVNLRNIHKGQRCFIVGNGPSLKTEDLTKLTNEVCFGSHRIFNIFSETEWRPTYYCAQDYELITNSAENIKKAKLENIFIGMVENRQYPKFRCAKYVKMNIDPFFPNLPEFSEDIASIGIYEGFTVSYMCLQLAIYMGFSEIYLLGIDHSYSKVLLENGEILENSTLNDHFSSNDTLENIPQLYKSALAYEKAKIYANEHGVEIYNATRGGCLDVFKRIDFDSLF